MDNIDAEKLGIDPDLFEQVLEEKIATSKRKQRPRPAARHIGAPQSFVNDVCLLTKGRAALVVALCIYRRTRVCHSRTVTLLTAQGGEQGGSVGANYPAMAMRPTVRWRGPPVSAGEDKVSAAEDPALLYSYSLLLLSLHKI
jgi:hypothetical protein